MFIDGYVENLKLFLETNNESIFKVSINLIGEIVKTLGYNFPGTLDSAVVLNGSNSLKLAWSGISLFIDKKAEEKISFMDTNEFLNMIK